MALKYVGPLAHWKAANLAVSGADFGLMFEKSSLGTGFLQKTWDHIPWKIEQIGVSIRCKSIIYPSWGWLFPVFFKDISWGRTLGIRVHVFRFSTVALSWHLGRLGLQRQGVGPLDRYHQEINGDPGPAGWYSTPFCWTFESKTRSW